MVRVCKGHQCKCGAGHKYYQNFQRGIDVAQIREPRGREVSNQEGGLDNESDRIVSISDLILAMSDSEINALFERFMVSTVMRITQ